MSWNDKMDKICRDGAAKKWSASKIAGEIYDELRVVLTRNAVIGYAHRKGIDISKGKSLSSYRARPLQKRRPRAPFKSTMLLVAHKQQNEKVHRDRARINFGLLAAHNPVTLLALNSEVCHWPLWSHEGQTPVEKRFYCGEGLDDGSVYCHEHHMQSVSGPRAPRSSLSPYRF